ncbi:hypothetical protein BDR04DRAFT_1028682 [Suillus decipiens]|nr:hypothetical protein BDR04DRAFT_1028682 [Suillus decipiens]
MDIDDGPLLQTIPDTANQPVDQVVRASHLSSCCPNDVVDDTGDKVNQTDLDALIYGLGEEEEDIKPQAKKRKSKKVVPIRCNCLKKCHVLKSPTTTDAKGYMHTEEYSSYKSTSEDEVVEVALEDVKKFKGKKKAETKLKDDVGDKLGQASSKVKETNSLRGSKANAGRTLKHGSLLNFFGPDKL